jgi:hypothetical protein
MKASVRTEQLRLIFDDGTVLIPKEDYLKGSYDKDTPITEAVEVEFGATWVVVKEGGEMTPEDIQEGRHTLEPRFEEGDQIQPTNVTRYAHHGAAVSKAAFLSSRIQPERAFDWLSLAVPKRIAQEDIGDALELIGNLRTDGASPWMIWLKVISTFCWVAMNSVREVTSALLGRKGRGLQLPLHRVLVLLLGFRAPVPVEASCRLPDDVGVGHRGWERREELRVEGLYPLEHRFHLFVSWRASRREGGPSGHRDGPSNDALRAPSRAGWIASARTESPSLPRPGRGWPCTACIARSRRPNVERTSMAPSIRSISSGGFGLFRYYLDGATFIWVKSIRPFRVGVIYRTSKVCDWYLVERAHSHTHPQ